MSGTRITLGSSALIIGSSTVVQLIDIPTPIVTTVAEQAITAQPITAAPNAVEVAGSTLSSRTPGVTICGALASLDSAGELEVGSKTKALRVSSGGGLDGLIVGGFGSERPFLSPRSSLAPGNNRTGNNDTVAGVQLSQGDVRGLKKYVPEKLSIIAVITVMVLLCGAG